MMYNRMLLTLMTLAMLPTLAFSEKDPAGAGLLDAEGEEKSEVKDASRGKQKFMTLSMGVSRMLEFTFVIGPIHLGDNTLFDAQRVKDSDGKERKLRLIPKNSGFTDMTIHDFPDGAPRITYSVRVTREDIGQVVSQLEELLGDIEGIRLRSVGGTVIIDGEILLPRDMIRIMRVVAAMKDRDPKKKEVPIRNIATISKITMNIIAERIEREINSPEVSARVLNNNILLEGTAENNFEADRAVEIAKTYLPEAFVEDGKGEGGSIKPKQAGGVGGGVPTIIDFLRVRPQQASPPAQDIKITMNYVELNNDYARNFNFEWRPLYSDSSQARFDSSLGELSANFVATITSLFPKLVTAKNHGHARILKQEQIIVKDRSDQPATIESSLQVYTTNIDAQGNRSLQPIPVQNVTKVRAATIPGSDAIELGIQITLNQFLGANQGQPIVSTNSLQTQVTVKNGDSAALGGYALDNITADYNRNPTSRAGNGNGGGSTPLFNLERSKSFERKKQQFIIFVTPEVLRTASAGSEDMIRKFRLNAGEK